MNIDFTADLQAMFSDFGEDVELRWTDQDGDHEVIFRGHLTQPTRTIDFSGVSVVSEDWTLDFPTSAANLKENDVITVGGQRYAVRSVESTDLGIVTQAKLRKL